MKRAPFSRPSIRESIGLIEFQHFKQLAMLELKDLFNSIRGAQLLDDIFSFWVDDSRDDQLQINLGNKMMHSRLSEGKTISESGPSLLYTIGPLGFVAVCLYPAKSKLFGAPEDHIYLRIGRYTGWQLKRKLKKDLNTFVDYAYVTSMDGDPSIFQILKIKWLRKFHPVQMKGDFVDASLLKQSGILLHSTLKSISVAVAGAAAKPLIIIIIALILLKISRPDLVKLVSGCHQ